MSDRPLLDRQISLLNYLTSGTAIFGGDAPSDPLLRGFDVSLLRLEARFSYEKRMKKIQGVFPKTFEFLGDTEDRIRRAFVETCRPVDLRRLENGEQFYDFLCTWWKHEPPAPPYLDDIAACELAMARVRACADEREPNRNMNGRRPAVRRHPCVVLRRCAYDVRPAFEGGVKNRVPKRNTRLAFAVPAGANQPQVFEVLPEVFALLNALKQWTDPATIGVTSIRDGLVRDLAARGLVEIRA